MAGANLYILTNGHVAGLKVGDILLSVDGQPADNLTISTLQQVRDAVRLGAWCATVFNARVAGPRPARACR